MPFTVKREDGRSLRKILYEAIIDRMDKGMLIIDGIVRHDELRALLRPSEQSSYPSTMAQVSSWLQKKRKRSLKSVRGVGYRLIAGTRQVEQAEHKHKSAVRAHSRALTVVKTADRSLMTKDAVDRADRIERALGMVVTVVRKQQDDLESLGSAVEALQEKQVTADAREKATEDALARITRRLDEMDAARGVVTKGG